MLAYKECVRSDLLQNKGAKLLVIDECGMEQLGFTVISTLYKKIITVDASHFNAKYKIMRGIYCGSFIRKS